MIPGDTVNDALVTQAQRFPEVAASFPSAGSQITNAELEEASRRAAHSFVEAGIGRGCLVGLLVPTTPSFLIALFGVLRAGGAVTVLPVQAGFGDSEESARQIVRVAATNGIRHLVLDSQFEEIGKITHGLMPELAILDPLSALDSSRALPAVEPDDLAVVQFTSGSTSSPKGVMLPHRSVVAGLNAIVTSGHFTEHDVFVQWVPTFHDMGLFGYFSCLLNGAPTHAFSPITFLRRPAEVVRYLADVRGSIMTGPNFSYDHLLDAMTPELLAQLDLSCWRLAFNGAEPISPETVQRFTDTLASCKLPESTMYPVYGMAEATLAITFPEPGSVPRIVATDGKRMVSVGKPVAGLEVRLVSEQGELCGPGTMGEIQISGQAVTTGYYRNPDATSQAFDGSWFRTGDLGLVLDGEYVIAGRAKDMIIVRGQNFFPEDVEAIAREVDGVYRRRCVAFAETSFDNPAGLGSLGTERIGVIVEADPRKTQWGDLRERVARQVSKELGLSEINVYMVKPRWLTRTTSGKWQRNLARERIRNGVGDNAQL